MHPTSNVKSSLSSKLDEWEMLTSGFNVPAWFGKKNQTKFDKLSSNISTDIVIVGAGIAGMTTAYLLSKDGRKVALIDDGFIVSGETGRTTAHITNALDDRYYNLERIHGKLGSRLAAESHTSAINLIESIVAQEGIKCDFERIDGYLFLDASDKADSLDRELKAVHNAGITSVTMMDQSPLKYRYAGPCLCFPNQGQFHPLIYMTGLAQAIKFKYNGDIFTETHAQEINSEEDKIIIKTSGGFRLTANSAVLSTNAPIVDDVSKIYDKQQAFRTYVIAVTIEKNSIPRGLYWDTGNQRSKEAVKPYHYVRTQKDWDDTHDLLIVGGEDHKTGSITSKKELENRFQRLDNWMRNRFPVRGPIIYRWSGQVMESNDGLAFIGLNPGPNKNIYIATGDSGNGITHGTLAGMILSDLIMGKKNDWIDLYSPSRTVPTSNK